MLSKEYFSQYYGHPIQDLNFLLDQNKSKRKIYLVGDSTMDNKKWVLDKISSPSNGYEFFIENSVLDVNHFVNHFLEKEKLPFISLNFAIEEAFIRGKFALDEHDKIVKNNINENDILIVSIGGNDIALKPSPIIILELFNFLICSEEDKIKNILDTFETNLKDYISNLIQNKKPKAVFICAPYYPCKVMQKSWASTTLNLMKYYDDPYKVHKLINFIYKKIKEIKIDNVNIIPVPIFEILDWEDENDYVASVEPSENGGRKIAKYFVDLIKQNV